MEIIKLIVMIITLLITLASTIGPLVIKLKLANKAREEAAKAREEAAQAEKMAKTEAEKAAAAAAQAEAAAAEERAYNDMYKTAQELIKTAETAFAGFDAVMKQQNGSAGAMKKKSVTTDLQAYALAHGYKYDAEFWSKTIDEIVAFTREVNAKKKTSA